MCTLMQQQAPQKTSCCYRTTGSLCVSLCRRSCGGVNTFRLSLSLRPHRLPMTLYSYTGPLIQSENGKWRLPVASCLGAARKHVYVHTLLAPVCVCAPRTHAPLDATLGSRSGDCQWKRKCHYSLTSVSTVFQL